MRAVWGNKKLRFAFIGVAVAVMVGLVLLVLIKLGSGDTPQNRAIAHDLLELHNQWPLRFTYTNKPSLLQSLTNLPFHAGASSAHKVFIQREHALLGMTIDEFYWLDQRETNLAQWTLYHGWYWHYRKFGREQKLLTIVETNAPPH